MGDSQGSNPFRDESTDALNPFFLATEFASEKRNAPDGVDAPSAVQQGTIYGDIPITPDNKDSMKSHYLPDSNPLGNSIVTSKVYSHSSSLSWDAIAAKLLSEKYLLTALELQGELIESGKDLPRLTSFFSNPAYFDLTAAPSLPFLPTSNSATNICEFIHVNISNCIIHSCIVFLLKNYRIIIVIKISILNNNCYLLRFFFLK